MVYNNIYIQQFIKLQKMQAESDPYFVICEKRRLKAEQMHKDRREQLFNRSRQLCFQQSIKSAIDQSKKFQQEDGQSSLNIENNIFEYFNIEQNQVKMVEAVEISPAQNNQQQTESNFNKGQLTSQHKSKSSNKITNHGANFSKKYSKLIQIPLWMNIVPEQLSKFYGLARPDGRSALIIFDEGWIYAYDKFGKKVDLKKIRNQQIDESIVRKLSQHLNGTILQVVLSQPTNSIFIMDMISWKQTIMTSQTFQFRYAWLLSNAPTQLLKQQPFNFQIKLVQYLPLQDKENLKKLYLNDFGYAKEGLLFVQKQSPYIHGVNENVMIWKDLNTSKYPIDEQSKASKQNQKAQNTNINNKISYIYGTGKLAKNGNIYSQDGYKLGHVNPTQIVGQLQGFIKFRITGIEFKTHERMEEEHANHMQIQYPNSNMNMILRDFQIVQYKKYGRVRADTLSRIIFQHRIRYDPLTIQTIASKLGITQ